MQSALSGQIPNPSSHDLAMNKHLEPPRRHSLTWSKRNVLSSVKHGLLSTLVIPPRPLPHGASGLPRTARRVSPSSSSGALASRPSTCVHSFHCTSTWILCRAALPSFQCSLLCWVSEQSSSRLWELQPLFGPCISIRKSGRIRRHFVYIPFSESNTRVIISTECAPSLLLPSAAYSTVADFRVKKRTVPS